MSSQRDLAGLSRVLVSLPNWQYSLAAAVVLGALAGVALLANDPIIGLIDGVLYVGMPTALAAFVTDWLDTAAGGDLSLGRSAALALICEVVVLGLWSLARLAALAVGPVVLIDTVVAALGFIVAVRALVLITVSRLSVATTAALAVLQPAIAVVVPLLTIPIHELGGVFAVVPVPMLFELSTSHRHADGVVLVILSAFYVLAAYLLLDTIDRPVRQSLEVTSLDFAHGMFRYLAGQPAALETFFEAFGQEVVVPVAALAFYRPDGTEKARIVVPSVHPGPMGDIGGGRLPAKLDAAADGVCFPLHGMAGHDFNPVSQSAVGAVVAAADDALAAVPKTTTATRSVRTTVGDSTLVGQRFGSTVYAASTFAPAPADDIDYGVGMAAAREVADADTRLLADSHNSNDGGETGFRRVTAGSPRGFSLQDATRQLGDRLAAAEEKRFSVGVAADRTRWHAAEGIGELGVRVAVVAAGDQRTAYVLVDGNNADLGVRDRVRDAVCEHVDDAELLTTDTHAVTRTTAVNQVGQHVDVDELCGVCVSLVEDAIADCEPASAAGGSATATVEVFGNGRTERFASLANSMVVVGIALFCVALVVAVAFTVVLFVFF